LAGRLIGFVLVIWLTPLGFVIFPDKSNTSLDTLLPGFPKSGVLVTLKDSSRY
jgi:hypothetical protein